MLFQTISIFFNPNECCGKFWKKTLKTKNIRSRFCDLDGEVPDNSTNVNTFDEFDLVHLSILVILLLNYNAQLLVRMFAFRFAWLRQLILLDQSYIYCEMLAILQSFAIMPKQALNPLDFTNYRPISKLPCISKILEKVVLSQLSCSLGLWYY